MTKINLIEKYVMVRHKLKATERELKIFELRNGVFENNKHTFVEIGEMFSISSSRVRQLNGKVEYLIEKSVID